MTLAAFPLAASAVEETPPNVRAAIRRGQAFLREEVQRETKLGQAALATMALVKSGEPVDSPLIKALAKRLASSVRNNQFESGDQQYDNYVAGVVLMALSTIDANGYFDEIEAIATHIMGKQNPNGSWDYSGGVNGDTSQSQYTCLALWEASAAGVYVPAEVWDKALHWFITRQDRGGGFTYHPQPPKDGKPANQSNVTHSMSTAGAGTMVLCRSQLPKLARAAKHLKHELLIPVVEEEEYKPLVTEEMAKDAIDKAHRWMASNINIAKPNGGHLYYYLYGVERYASLSELRRIGSTNWYIEGTQFLLEQQKPDGTWQERYPPIVDTSFALLFLGRSTEKTIERIRVVRLGAGTMLGGRGIPAPDSAGVALRRKDRFKKIPKAPIEELLSLIESPSKSAVAADQTAVALENVDSDELVRKVGSDLAKLRELAKDANPGVRQAALTALARTMDYTVVPVLIHGLQDSDPKVYKAARDGLRWISRSFVDFDLPDSPPEPEVLKTATKRWQEWFASLQVEVPARQKFDE